MHGYVPKSFTEIFATYTVAWPHPGNAFEAHGQRHDGLVERSSLLNVVDDDWRHTLAQPRQEYACAHHADNFVRAQSSQKIGWLLGSHCIASVLRTRS
jgi:hypothetical protein